MANNLLTATISVNASGVTQTFQAVGNAVNKTEQQLKKLPNVTNQSTLALSNLSRVAQDAPYGFLGIANNLNPLLESFQRLKQSTGSTSAAFKSLGQSLTGAGGIGLALGIVSSLLVVFGDKLFGASKAAKEADEANKKLAEGLSDQLVKLTSLVGIVGNVNAKYGEKQKALAAINQEYKTYLADLGIEEVTAGNVADAYDRITQALIRQAVVKGLQEEISKAVEGTARQIIALEKAEERRRLAQQEANGEQRKEISAQEAATDAANKFNKVRVDGAIAQQRISQQQTADIGRLNTYDTALDRLTASLKAQLSPLLNLTANYEDLGIKLDKTDTLKLKPKKVEIRPELGSIDLELPTIFDPAEVSKFSKQLSELTKNINLKIPITIDLSLPQKGIQASIKAAKDAAAAIAKPFEDAGELVSEAIANLASDSISALAEGFGEALATGDLGKGFKAFADTVANGLIAIGKQMIAAAPVILALKAAIKTLNPAVLLPAGIALVAIGAALKGALTIQGRATGGPVMAGQPYIVGERGRELFVPNTGGSIIPNNQLGGTGVGGSGFSVMATIENILRGKDLVQLITLQNQSNSRLQ